jgi:hypothetical protein
MLNSFHLLIVGFLFGFLFNPEDRGSILLQSDDKLEHYNPEDYTLHVK